MQKSMQHWIDDRFWSWWNSGLYKTGRNCWSWWSWRWKRMGKFALENEMKGVYVFGVTDIWNENVWGLYSTAWEKKALRYNSNTVYHYHARRTCYSEYSPFVQFLIPLSKYLPLDEGERKLLRLRKGKSSWDWFFNGSKKCPPSVSFLSNYFQFSHISVRDVSNILFLTPSLILIFLFVKIIKGLYFKN